MIKGIGVDIVEIDRIKKAIEKHRNFINRLYTPLEQSYCLGKNKPHLHFAVRFAAKEAVLKAFGTGFRGVSWTDIEIDRDVFGKPEVKLSGNALKVAEEKKINQILISLSFDKKNAIAMALVYSLE
jgi:holo-[acyl-carrier protein] synthase